MQSLSCKSNTERFSHSSPSPLKASMRTTSSVCFPSSRMEQTPSTSSPLFPRRIGAVNPSRCSRRSELSLFGGSQVVSARLRHQKRCLDDPARLSRTGGPNNSLGNRPEPFRYVSSSRCVCRDVPQYGCYLRPSCGPLLTHIVLYSCPAACR